MRAGGLGAWEGRENRLSISAVWPLSGISDNRNAHCHICKLRIAPKSLAPRKYPFLAHVPLPLFNCGPVSKGADRLEGLIPLNWRKKAEGNDVTSDSPFSDRRSSSISWIPDLMLGHDCIKSYSSYGLISMDL